MITSTDSQESEQQQDSSPISNVNCFGSATSSSSLVRMRAASCNSFTQITKSGLSKTQFRTQLNVNRIDRGSYISQRPKKMNLFQRRQQRNSSMSSESS